ncbi:carboxypeptidase M32 [Collinsella tanakaei]|uniref:carboxypeptidase M32 n=1 Tax=Collinsella tanakaei TaxID=626935 RepID=UPI0025A47A81|nr:carboxypeptidase M32 [Collinsella tanakaei]MDM8300445.1 carboxypeptidase M32 [Collinsella tanakaei]
MGKKKDAGAKKLGKKLRGLERKLSTYDYLMKVTQFDGATIAPENGAAARGEALAALAGGYHRLLTSDDAVELVHDLHKAAAKGKIGDKQLAAEVRVLARDQREASAIPAEEEEAWTRLTCEADAVWHKAKAANDWASFEPYVDRIVEACKRRATCLDSTKDPYDVLLDQYERGLTMADFDAFCDQVRETVVPLVHGIVQRGYQPDAPFLAERVPEHVQKQLSFDLIDLVGIDRADTTLAFTEHPFSEGFAPGDARIATHIYEDNLISNVYSIIHEAGHAIYELGVDPAYAYTCLAGGTSMGIHESQSRFFENIVGRSRPFMGPLLKVLRRRVPGVYGDVSEDELYRAVNIAQPSLIRTEADELTYPLHVMIRYEIERALFAGEATAHDIPGMWSDLTAKYLGIEVPDDTHGCLQDTHWSGGDFGYFPTYALGSAYGSQLLRAMVAERVDFGEACASGDLAPVRAWLGDKIWRWGRSKDAPELIEGACGEPFDATYYCSYLAKKFGALYAL